MTSRKVASVESVEGGGAGVSSAVRKKGKAQKNLTRFKRRKTEGSYCMALQILVEVELKSLNNVFEFNLFCLRLSLVSLYRFPIHISRQMRCRIHPESIHQGVRARLILKLITDEY